MGFSSSNSLFLSYITTFSATRYLLIKLDNFLAPYLDAYNDVLSSLSSKDSDDYKKDSDSEPQRTRRIKRSRARAKRSAQSLYASIA